MKQLFFSRGFRLFVVTFFMASYGISLPSLSYANSPLAGNNGNTPVITFDPENPEAHISEEDPIGFPDHNNPLSEPTSEETTLNFSSSSRDFFAYSAAFHGGVTVAAGDINGDGRDDIITGAGPGAGPHVKVFDGATNQEIRSFFAYGAAFRGGVSVAAGDINGDGVADIITGAGAGAGPHVKVFDGATNTEIRSFFAFSANFHGGITVGSGDINNDGADDIIVGAGPGAGPHVKVFDGRTNTELRSFFAYGAAFRGGVFVAGGDINGDGHDDIVTGAGAGAGPHVKVFDGNTNNTLRSFFAYAPAFHGGVQVGARDVNGDGRDDIITGAGPGAGPHVKVFDATTSSELQSFFAYANTFRGGVFVGAADINGDGKAGILTGAGAGAGPHVRVLENSSFTTLFPSSLENLPSIERANKMERNFSFRKPEIKKLEPCDKTQSEDCSEKHNTVTHLTHTENRVSFNFDLSRAPEGSKQAGIELDVSKDPMRGGFVLGLSGSVGTGGKAKVVFFDDAGNFVTLLVEGITEDQGQNFWFSHQKIQEAAERQGVQNFNHEKTTKICLIVDVATTGWHTAKGQLSLHVKGLPTTDNPLLLAERVEQELRNFSFVQPMINTHGKTLTSLSIIDNTIQYTYDLEVGEESGIEFDFKGKTMKAGFVFGLKAIPRDDVLLVFKDESGKELEFIASDVSADDTERFRVTGQMMYQAVKALRDPKLRGFKPEKIASIRILTRADSFAKTGSVVIETKGIAPAGSGGSPSTAPVQNQEGFTSQGSISQNSLNSSGAVLILSARLSVSSPDNEHKITLENGIAILTDKEGVEKGRAAVSNAALGFPKVEILNDGAYFIQGEDEERTIRYLSFDSFNTESIVDILLGPTDPLPWEL